MKKLILALAMLFATWSGLATAEDDPYATAVRKAIDNFISETTDSFKRQADEVFYAMGCRVITKQWFIMPNLERLVRSEAGIERRGYNPTVYKRLGEAGIYRLQERLYDALSQARHDGLAEAGVSDPEANSRQVGPESYCLHYRSVNVCPYLGPIGNNCAWWHEHPEAVLAIREHWETSPH